MDLLSSFKDFAATHHLFTKEDRLLLAVSGGVDSVVLCELCQQAGLDLIIAHCNFQLRGAESDRDEQFVRQLATRFNREVLVKKFDTEQYAADHKCSIQVAARELRYAWFHTIIGDHPANPAPQVPASPDLRPVPSDQGRPSGLGGRPTSPGPKFILTAHHLDDNIETLLMNFFKGTGIAGLRAMLPRQGSIVHPLLFATKAQLQQFAQHRHLTWVEDSSNVSDKYTRNYFRHQLIPLVQQVYPGAMDNLAGNIDRFREIEMVYRQAIQQQKKKLLEYKPTGQGAGVEIHIPVLKLKKSQPLPTLIYEIISDFGFSPQQVGSVIDLLDSPSGKYIRSTTHRILKDRNWLIISTSQTAEAAHILIESPGTRILYEQGALQLEYLPPSGVPASLSPPDRKPQLPAPEPIAWLDAAHIKFPLLLRKWQPGDYFYPLGLRKKKKLARFFIDNKLSLADKEKIWVLEMDKKIIWVVGLRIDDRFRITPQTQQVLKIEMGMA